MAIYRSYSRIVISGGETVVVQIAVLRVASGNPWLARPPNPAEPRLADARRWAALAAHGLDRLAAASRHLAGTSGYLWIGGAVGIRSLNAVKAQLTITDRLCPEGRILASSAKSASGVRVCFDRA
ncbi:hypothetical protein C8R44DRAFT_727372 [Mycena epipterygia]|nr:hypothetical protein C8R44DRAFT_727372 [Mycena epipterygia]